MDVSFGDFYRGKRVLVTGHTGFKGGWLSLWLNELGAVVSGLALDPATMPNLYELIAEDIFKSAGSETRGDIRDIGPLHEALRQSDPEIIFHLAAQSLVRRSYKDPLETLQTNMLGTANLLEAVRRRGRACTIVVVTTDKCYENREWDFAYREEDRLGGWDVYSMSKAATELVVAAWRRSFFANPVAEEGRVRVATARAGNVIGGGDYASDRIVPDSAVALSRGEPVSVRNPKSTRPWQHVLESLSGYLLLAASLASQKENSKRQRLESAFNFGPTAQSNQTVAELVTEFVKLWPGGKWRDISVSGKDEPHEAGRLSLAIDKASGLLGWFPVWNFTETVQRTAHWYRTYYSSTAPDKNRMRQLCLADLKAYTVAAANRV